MPSAPNPRPSGAPEPDGLRAAVERRSAPLVVYLYRLPRWVLLLGVFALLAVGMVGTGWVGAAGLGVLTVLLGWFAYLNWPALSPGGRPLRIVGIAVLAAFTIARVVEAL